MVNGNNMKNILQKNTEPNQRRVRKYIRNLTLAVLVMGLLTLFAVNIIRSADNMIKGVPVTGVRG